MANTVGSAWNYVLGIDLGSASVGWAAIGLDENGAASQVLRAGVRVFDAGVTGDIEKGQDESNAAPRRYARLKRRQFRRRAARQRELFQLLQRHGMLPRYEGGEAEASQQRHSILNHLDRDIYAKWSQANATEAQAFVDLPLYALRKTALDVPLEPFELGRVFYHFSQRRGYRSNRKDKAAKQGGPAKDKKEEDLSQIEADIKTLAGEIECSGARTLGEYFASLNPHQQKVRRRWTSRRMYEDEFARIWEKQVSFQTDLLTEDLQREIKRLLFYQRPFRGQNRQIGGCELEPGQRRAAWATLEAQQFRVLKQVNDLELMYPGQTAGIPLTAVQRKAVLDLLENSAEVTFQMIRETLKLRRNVGFNLQRDGETTLKGNYTKALMVMVFADRWPSLSEEDKRQVVEDWRTIEGEDSLIRRTIEHWKVDEAGAAWLASQPAPAGYCSLSRKAIRKLMPLLQDGRRFKEAENTVYGNRFSDGRVYDRIPPVRDVLKTLPSPAIERSLTELRKVVNALVGEYGKPLQIRIELRRDLKTPRRERAKAAARNRSGEKELNATMARLVRELGPRFKHPSRAVIEKATLHDECGGICPYTGRHIAFASLFGRNPQFEVEHIIPFSHLPDDSFQNKTLCYHEEKRFVKRNHTPFDAYREPQRYEAILDRVRSWPKQNLGKLKRFELRTAEELEDFSSRQLNDTSRASRLACELLGTLYGGRDVRIGSGNRRVVFASSGMLTATLRRGWGLEATLRELDSSADGLGKGDPRADHRHHAINAITIALNQPDWIAALSHANSEDPFGPANDGSAPTIQTPWRGFVDSVRPHIEQMLVSHRPEHRLNGALHGESNYGRPRLANGKEVVHIRKPVPGLSATDIEDIVDSSVRAAVAEKAALFGGDLSKWTPGQNPEDWPHLKTKSGRCIPIKRVRVKKTLHVESIADGPRQRYVLLARKHHMAIFASVDRGREQRWEAEVVPLFEAMSRKRRNQPIIHTKIPTVPEAVFKFSVMWGDVLQLHKDCHHKRNICKPSYWRVRTICQQGKLILVSINDARLVNEIQAAKARLLSSAESLRQMNAEKVTIDPLGRIHRARF